MTLNMGSMAAIPSRAQRASRGRLLSRLSAGDVGGWHIKEPGPGRLSGSPGWLVIRGATGDGTSIVDGREFRFRYTVQSNVSLAPGSPITTFPTITLPADPDDNTDIAWNLTEWLNVSSAGTTKLGPGDVIGAGYYPTPVDGIVRGWWIDGIEAYVFFESNPMTSWAQEARLGAP